MKIRSMSEIKMAVRLIANFPIALKIHPPHSLLMKRFVRSALAAVLVTAASAAPGNFYRVDSKVWRSAQPDAADFSELQKLGIREVLNLREWHDDSSAATNTAVNLHRVSMNAGHIHEQEIVEAVKILRDARGPILVHCLHGSDRTGTVVALYRMTVDGWSRDQAIAEFTMPRYGYHAGIYPKLCRYLETVDIARFKAAMNGR